MELYDVANINYAQIFHIFPIEDKSLPNPHNSYFKYKMFTASIGALIMHHYIEILSLKKHYIVENVDLKNQKNNMIYI